MNHLETLTRQYNDWKGYLVKGNVKVGRLARGGWAGELDIVAYHPQTNHLVHIEPSIDARSWEKREQRFQKKFHYGKEFIYKDVFPWLSSDTKLEQIAILITSSRNELCGGKVISIDERRRGGAMMRWRYQTVLISCYSSWASFNFANVYIMGVYCHASFNQYSQRSLALVTIWIIFSHAFRGSKEG